MADLIDTSVLGRLGNTADPSYAIADGAVHELHRRGEVLYITPQNLIEFRNMATRSSAHNGLGLTPAETESCSLGFEKYFPLLTETPDIFPAWKAIVENLGIIGKQVHDARLVAVCHVHGISHILTFNTSHFTRLAGFGPGIMVDPRPCDDPATALTWTVDLPRQKSNWSTFSLVNENGLPSRTLSPSRFTTPRCPAWNEGSPALSLPSTTALVVRTAR